MRAPTTPASTLTRDHGHGHGGSLRLLRQALALLWLGTAPLAWAGALPALLPEGLGPQQKLSLQNTADQGRLQLLLNLTVGQPGPPAATMAAAALPAEPEESVSPPPLPPSVGSPKPAATAIEIATQGRSRKCCSLTPLSTQNGSKTWCASSNCLAARC